MKDKILKIIFLVWVVLWVWFIIRGLFLKGEIKSYKALLSRSLEGKYSYVTGDRLYEFFMFCNKNIPENSRYSFMGLEKTGLDERRGVYYLYPRIEAKDPDYILVYGTSVAVPEGYHILIKLDDLRYILKK